MFRFLLRAIDIYAKYEGKVLMVFKKYWMNLEEIKQNMGR